jgi:hypothetical protein
MMMLKYENGRGCVQQSAENCQSCANKLLHEAGFRLDGTPVSKERRRQFRFVALTDPEAKKARMLAVLE